jgi:hypothetical protein
MSMTFQLYRGGVLIEKSVHFYKLMLKMVYFPVLYKIGPLFLNLKQVAGSTLL